MFETAREIGQEKKEIGSGHSGKIKIPYQGFNLALTLSPTFLSLSL